MGRGSTFQPRFWPSGITLVCATVLVALGVWQLHRMAWKLDLIAWREARLAEPVVPLPDILPDESGEEWRFRRFTASGILEHDNELYQAGNRHKQVGFQVITPLRRPDGSVILVDRGWVPADRRDPARRGAGQATGTVTIEGKLRGTEKQGWFVPDNDPDENVWFWRDLSAMATAAGVEAPAVILQAGTDPNPGGFPVGAEDPLPLRNDHLQYAITWFSLLAALLVIYYLSQRRRRPGSA